MSPTAEHGIIARLDAIGQRLDRIERWMERHDDAHDTMAAHHAAAAIALEKRLTQAEARLGQRTWIGGVGLLISTILGAMGVKL